MPTTLKPTFQLVAITLLAIVTPQGVAQQAAQPVSTNTFKVRQVIERSGEVRLGHRSLIDYQGVKYTALMPPTYRVRTSEEQKRVVGYSPDSTCSLTLAFWPAAQLAEDQKFDHDFLRWWIEEQSGGGKILEETWRHTLGSKAPTFDVGWRSKAGVAHKTRITFISLPGTLIEVSMMSRPENFTLNSYAHADLLGSLQKSGKDGKLEITPLSNKY